MLSHPGVSREHLASMVWQIPGAGVGIKIVALSSKECSDRMQVSIANWTPIDQTLLNKSEASSISFSLEDVVGELKSRHKTHP